jgi:hypothetical protein
MQPDDVEIGIPEKTADDGVYWNSYKIDKLRNDQWLYSDDIVTDGDGVDTWRGWWATPSPVARARADEIIATFDKWEKRINRKPRGYHAAERAHRRADQHVWKLQREIFETQAFTLAGLTAKAKVVDLDDSDDEGAFLRAFARDILAMNAGAQS